MYSKEQLIAAIQKEFAILKHLGTKIETEQHLSHKFTDAQRTIKELMIYLAYSIEKQVRLIVKGERDASVFADMEALGEQFDPAHWGALLDSECDTIVQAIQGLTAEQLAESVHLFGRTQTRAEFLVGYLLTMLGAYKMQLFLQLKHAGRVELGTYNLRAGMDAPVQ